MKLLGYSIIKTDDLVRITQRLDAIERFMRNYDAQSERQAEAQILVFNQMESRLKLMELLHGVKFEPSNPGDLIASGDGRHVKIDKESLKNLMKKAKAAWVKINKENPVFKKIGKVTK